MYAMNTSEEQQNGYFGSYDNEISHSEFSCLRQSVINEDYGLHMYGDTIHGNFSPPSAIDNERANLEKFMSNDILCQRAGVCTEPQPSELLRKKYAKTVAPEKKNGQGREAGKSFKNGPKTVKKNVRELLKAFSILRPSATKDGHSKVATSRGVRDRRIKLSYETSIKFFFVQDTLGFDQPSKALEWLMEQCRPAIDELPKTVNSFSPSMGAHPPCSTAGCVMENLRFPAEASIDSTWAGNQAISRCLDPTLNYTQGGMQSSPQVGAFQCFSGQLEGSSMQSMESFAGLNSTTFPPCAFPSTPRFGKICVRGE